LLNGESSKKLTNIPCTKSFSFRRFPNSHTGRAQVQVSRKNINRVISTELQSTMQVKTQTSAIQSSKSPNIVNPSGPHSSQKKKHQNTKKNKKFPFKKQANHRITPRISKLHSSYHLAHPKQRNPKNKKKIKNTLRKITSE